jgi:aspartate carbamoyltransferase regulatory subunit
MSEQYTDVTVTCTNPKNVTDVGDTADMVQAEFSPTKNKFSFMRWYRCKVCGLTFREDEVVLVKGAPYCIKYKHYLEA